ncbi:endonuclease-8 [Friedmanniella endophytica]|uniref:DNA-(apurinic or apyrimidinic site) lyase n=1 Tax=Microlunatus kandeliicorticis TaxID=1759536 RepID=A0A7W3IVM7_9ACTN|nr:Fpg/Nei family DNA glycosylase [Microlunatus kandeliicorticis]MBA8796087.1 endonuclease-8 [Microlunatus kandeliicorticis]
MPEGHTLHRLAGALDAAFAGTRPRVSSPQGRFAESAALIDGTAFLSGSAHGKHLFCDFAGDRVLHIHLGLIGKLRVERTAPQPPRGEIRLRLATDEAVADLSGPQICRLVGPAEVSAVIAELGPDPLRADADPDLAWRRIQRSSRPVAALLMDQAVLSGVGNVYRAEVLFRARVNPFTPGKQLTRRSWTAMWADLVELMPLGVASGTIDTVRPEHTPEAMGRPPREDDHGGEVYVYRRPGMPCFVCGAKVRTEVLAGRNLFWCGRCQRRH